VNANLIEAITQRAPRPNYGASQINHQWTDEGSGLTFSGVMHYDHTVDEDGAWTELRVFCLTHISYGNTSRALDRPIDMNPDCCGDLDRCELAIIDVERGL
jgi:hypothetical protein